MLPPTVLTLERPLPWWAGEVELRAAAARDCVSWGQVVPRPAGCGSAVFLRAKPAREVSWPKLRCGA
eukprot:1631492-Alexandrium_andersonii.AAC.1